MTSHSEALTEIATIANASAYAVGIGQQIGDDTMDDVMIDIETMSLHPHKALILSIGMVEFNPSRIEGLEIGEKSLLVLDIPEQLLLRRRVDLSTQEFWSKQPVDASKHWVAAGEMIFTAQEAINNIIMFCHSRKRVWANGTQFDLSNIVGLADDIHLDRDALWHYRAPRDMRTFIEETEATRLIPVGDALDIPGVPHEPIYDCIVQAWQVWSHYRDKGAGDGR